MAEAAVMGARGPRKMTEGRWDPEISLQQTKKKKKHEGDGGGRDENIPLAGAF